MKYRNLFLKYYSPDNGDGGGGGGGGGGQQQGQQGQQGQQQQGQQQQGQQQQQQGQQGQQAPTASEIAAEMVKLLSGGGNDNGNGNGNGGFKYKDHLNDDEKRQEQKQAQTTLENAIKFNNSIATVLADNKESFPERTQSLLTKTFDSEPEKAEALKKFAAKDFFTVKGNLELLPEAQQLAVKAQLTNEHGEIAMTGDQAWALVESALYVASVKADASKKSGLYESGGQGGAPKNVQAFIDRAYPKDVRELAEK